MKLSQTVELSLFEHRLLIEDAPRWGFEYDNWHNDPNPDILLLGAYRHPSTKNNLVGGINLHYLDQNQKYNLAKTLPKIMAGKNLYDRYHLGINYMPAIFKNYYRTYNAEYMRGIRPDVFKTKHGFTKAAKDWIVNTIKNVFRTKQQRQQAAKPQYPDDLQAMQDRVDQISKAYATQAPRSKTVEPEPGYDLTATQQDVRSTPEFKAANDNFKKLQQQNDKTSIDMDVDDVKDYFASTQLPDELPEVQEVPEDLTQYQETPEIELTQQKPEKAKERPSETQPKQVRQEPIEQNIEEPENDLEEHFIRYYSPVHKKYIIECFNAAQNQSTNRIRNRTATSRVL